ncbi:DUF4179 domain-containing protein [Paenibacillus camerounensis]|uniref:DUF4179 domain-containing protein n=1 Tax=Paenibacillus camerounensis TaxID=1243663 RepID=UPI0005A79B44|nr:DUF4179 domain-containing protein [Paenibacillus camerounensis]
MINSREEQIMLEEAARLQLQLQGETDNHQIRLAVQNGMERGKSGSKRNSLMKGAFYGVAVAAVVAFVLFIIPVWHADQQIPVNTEPQDWGVLEPFREFISYKNNAETFESAVRNDYVQLLDNGVEVDGYLITLNAVTADENRIILLYTAETSNDQEIYGFSSSRMLDVQTGNRLNRTGGIGAHAKLNGEEDYHKYYGKSEFELDRSRPFPEQLEADFLIASVDPGKMDDPKTGTIMADIHYSPRIKFVIDLDQKFKETKTEVIYPNKEFQIEGHEVVLSRVEMSPLMIKVRYELKNEDDYKWEVRQRVFDYFFGTIASRSGSRTVELPMNTGAGLSNGYEQVFASNRLDHPDSLLLEIKSGLGIDMFVKQFELLK